jgi:LysM repeat protein
MGGKRFAVVSALTVLMLLIGILPLSAAPDESGIIHVVQAGETLYSIARRYGVDVQAIARANGLVNTNLIYVGQRLLIPARQPAGAVHVVQAGETLLSIALRYGVSTWTIVQANGISNPNHIYVGQRLTIPGTAASAPKATPKPQPILPSSFPGPWSGEYFGNVTLTSPAYVTRDDGSINFDWGWGSPASGMPADSFSVRWTGTFGFSGDDYRFYAKVDDGVRVYVDDECIIDGWRDGGLRTYSADWPMAAGNHAIKVEYYDRIQVARIYVWWHQVSAPTSTPGPTGTPGPSPTPTPTPTATPVPDSGWLGEFYNNESLEGSPATTTHDPWIGFDWGADSPIPGVVWSEQFSVRWTTHLSLKTDHYRFCVMSDDGARIRVGGTLVVDEWRANNGIAYCGSYWAETGVYKVEVEYYEHGGEALIYVWWEPH